MPVLKKEIVDPIHELGRLEVALMFFACVLIAMAKVAEHVLARPRKLWCEPLTKRWFRFRSSFVVVCRDLQV